MLRSRSRYSRKRIKSALFSQGLILLQNQQAKIDLGSTQRLRGVFLKVSWIDRMSGTRKSKVKSSLRNFALSRKTWRRPRSGPSWPRRARRYGQGGSSHRLITTRILILIKMIPKSLLINLKPILKKVPPRPSIKLTFTWTRWWVYLCKSTSKLE